MDKQALLQSLNPEQQQAVSAPPQNMLVLAGAGSGKTRVLVHRIAWLMDVEHVSPFSILAVTFTNKAAYEMRGRIETILGMPLSSMWVGTFHGLAHRLLRSHWQEAGLSESFQIMDSNDQFRLIRRVHRTLNLDENKWQPKQSQWFINKSKEDGQRPDMIKDMGSNYYIETMVKVYKAYEEVCKRSGLVDFCELLLRSLELLQNNPQILQHYRQRFRHILVDEFQDTNTIQYQWIRTLAGDDNFVMAVGDDDQSIYSWRGAKVENIQRFQKDFANTQVIRLEQNYRSTQTILNASNAVIENNTSRMGKKLWTDGYRGDPITLYAAFNERDEAYYINTLIQNWLKQGDHQARDIAILYRSNAQSRILEEKLIDAQIPYRIYGGLKFFERAEIKDALGYLRLLANRNDDAAFERVVNLPTRGIGNTTLAHLRTTARDNSVSLWQAAEFVIEKQTLNGRATNALKAFIDLINTIDHETAKTTLDEQCDLTLQRSGLLAHYKKDRSEQGLSRIENLEELTNAMSQFKPDPEEQVLTPLAAFLSHVALETGEGQSAEHSNCVNLMTLHAAKGLEFPFVIIAGMEEDLFPHRMSTEEPHGLEEERRLCYVGMTRAMQKLVLTYAESRRLHGMERYNQPSRFIHEIPSEFVESVRPQTKISRPTQFHSAPKRNFKTQTTSDTGLKLGQRVKHKKFGSGCILNFEGNGAQARVQVKFDKHGTKWLVASFANLETA